ncbi:MAG: menaquinone biosynthesis protein [Acidobacteria bacterium]|jgi:chorismate dehydratase|nr:menaquinone biosynthesis protein [Acidobacteriota bacterium]
MFFSKPRVAAVSYLNTVPLVWGMLQGPQKDAADLSFCLPAECSDRLRDGKADIGLIPVIEAARQNLPAVPGTGIACDGAVRSILLFTKTPWTRIRRLAVDHGSRTSVMLTRILLRERFGVQPDLVAMRPHLPTMLADADAALLIGDAALRVQPERQPYEYLDLGAAWHELTGLPMVFARWAGPHLPPDAATLFDGSWQYGQERLPEIIDHQADRRGLPRNLVREYLQHHIRFTIGPRELQGLDTYLHFAASLEPALSPHS